MGSKYRVVQAGAGGMGRGWLRQMKEHAKVEIVGIADLNRDAALAAVDEFNLDKAICDDNLKALLDESKPDLVIDVTIPAAHHKIVTTALKNGYPVLGEKPMAESMAQAREMVKTSESTGKIYMVSQNYRWNHHVRAMKKAVADGLIGKVTTINMDFYIGAHFGGFRDEMDHPLLLDMSIHHFDMMRCVSGADPEAVYCHEFNPQGSWYRGDVSAQAIFEMSGGLVFNYRGSWCSEGHNTPWNAHWRIIGERGSITWDGANAPVLDVLSGDDEGFQRPTTKSDLKPFDEGLAGQMGSLDRFLAALENGTQPETWCGDNIKSLAMVFAAVESAGKKRRLHVDM